VFFFLLLPLGLFYYKGLPQGHFARSKKNKNAEHFIEARLFKIAIAIRTITKLSPNSSFSWAELALFLFPPDKPMGRPDNPMLHTDTPMGRTDKIMGRTDKPNQEKSKLVSTHVDGGLSEPSSVRR
jgi:hypothetical protein